jgi:hypothetical protein
LVALAERLPRGVVGMEACGGVHHLGRLFAHGHHLPVGVFVLFHKLARVAWAVLRRAERFAVAGPPVAA